MFTIALVPGLATAANTRTLWIGSPDAQTNTGKIFATKVSVPSATAPVNSTLFVVQIKSTDNQNLAHTILTINSNAGPNTGLSLNTYYDPDGGSDADDTFCSDDSGVITCNYGSLAAGTERTVAVVVNVASTYVVTGQVKPLFTARVTTNNENGTNQQLFTADSGPFPPSTTNGFAVTAFDGDNVFTFTPDGDSPTLFTSPVGGNNKLQSTVNFTADGGKLVSMTEGTSAPTDTFYRCPTGLNCQPFWSQVTAGNGTFDSAPYFTWTLTALVPKSYTLSQGFVAHYQTGAADPDWTLLFKDKSSLCGADITAKIEAQGHCISALSLSKPVNNVSTLVVTVVMDHQGGLKY